ncbi:aldo/keto reductase [Alkalihalobacillus sp. CinArs1]|uniref:aldo/keto reductase n=1 Tax=Alkalihalobacillus sp. CinArs1 TaxID=2995314 RepID=UPI003FA41F49
MSKMTLSKTVKLNNGVEMPQVGLGVFQVKEEEQLIGAVTAAIKNGYKSIDTAAIYGNEEWVGKAVNEAGVPREELFITSKVWNSDQGYNETIQAFEASLERMDLEYLDLYLIHWPVEGKFVDTWKAMEHLYHEGKIKAIGVSNFHIHHLETLFKETTVKPVVNQIELHPKLNQKEIRDFCEKHEIKVEAWSPLMQGELLENEELKDIAEKHNKSTAQVILRWHLQNDVIIIPKSTKEHRIKENADLFDFELSNGEMDRINALNEDKRVGPDPDNFDF